MSKLSNAVRSNNFRTRRRLFQFVHIFSSGTYSFWLWCFSVTSAVLPVVTLVAAFLSETVTVTCSNWTAASRDLLQDSVQRTMKLQTIVYSKLGEAPVSLQNPQLENQLSLTWVDESQRPVIQNTGLLFIQSLLEYELCLSRSYIYISFGSSPDSPRATFFPFLYFYHNDEWLLCEWLLCHSSCKLPSAMQEQEAWHM